MSKIVSYALFSMVGALIGFGASWFIFQEKMSYKDEAIIGAEIELLNLAADQRPDCQKLSIGSGIYATTNDNLLLVWRKTNNGGQLEKIILNKQLLSASEFVKDPC